MSEPPSHPWYVLDDGWLCTGYEEPGDTHCCHCGVNAAQTWRRQLMEQKFTDCEDGFMRGEAHRHMICETCATELGLQW